MAFLIWPAEVFGGEMGKLRQGIDWIASDVVDGIRAVDCESWNGFNDFITNHLLDFRSYVFRGHADEEWCLEPTIDRLIRSSGRTDTPHLRRRHLEAFNYATRGRRGPNPQTLSDEDECWAIGQHNGLATPLLDWTESPYVAAYFAFASADKCGASDRKVVFALNRYSILQVKKSKKIGDKDSIRFIRLMSDDNNRLIAQRGLFTRTPDGFPIEDWIKKYFEGISDGGKLLKITLPAAIRPLAIKSLDKMNVNHLSLFPDIYGAAKYTNMSTVLDAHS